MFGCKSSKVVFIDCLPILGFVFFKFLCTQEPGATCSPPALQVKTLGDFPHNLRHQSGTPSVPSADSNTWRKQTAARGLRPASAWPSTVTGTPSATSRPREPSYLQCHPTSGEKGDTPDVLPRHPVSPYGHGAWSLPCRMLSRVLATLPARKFSE